MSEKNVAEEPKTETGKKPSIRILLACPAYGGVVHCSFMISMIESLKVLSQFGIEVNLFMPESESLITRGRNAACAVFLAGDYTHLLFIDTDIRFPPIAIIELLKSGHPICGIPYPIKQIDWEHAHERLEPGLTEIQAQSRLLKRYCLDFKNITGDQEAYLPEFDDRGFCKVENLGTGFLMIRRDVLVSMSRMARQYVNDVRGYDAHGPDVKNYFFDFFDTLIHPETRRYLSEDYAFCFKAQRQGFDIWARPGIQLSHSGKMEFFGDFWRTYKFKNPKTGEYIQIKFETKSSADALKDSLADPKTDSGADSSAEPEDPVSSEIEELEAEISEVLETDASKASKKKKKKR